MKKADGGTVFIDIMIYASVETVWQAWTDPFLIRNWFGSDPNGVVLKASLDVKPGGCFEINFKDSDHTEHTCTGIYIVVAEWSKLSFSWAWKSEPGFESFVTVLLMKGAHYTRMQFEHANLMARSKHDYEKGWQATFIKLQRMLDKMKGDNHLPDNEKKTL